MTNAICSTNSASLVVQTLVVGVAYCLNPDQFTAL